MSPVRPFWIVLLSFALCGAAEATGASGSVTLAWNPTPGVAGYRLYMGIASRTYLTMLDVGPSTSATIADLTPGTTYYFAVTDYDTNQLESAFSGEISYTVPLLTGLTKLALTLTPLLHQAVLSGTGPVGYAYNVQTSSDLLNWTTVGAVTNSVLGTFQFIDLARPANTRSYYRLKQSSP